ncbi:unnamed protein product [Mytilus coruscus]|uniref:Integrase catalytic domain-containing protein n=1 Tax=Mytilus coruscus TaxID=42192 RepID=A0A6J8A7Q0_MYTCO|nr:unnamed protein product [Mytilus coruscus]
MERWKQTMNLYLEVAMGEKTEKEQCRAVLYVIGLEGREIYNTLNFGENEADKLEVLLKKFEDYCIPKKKCYSNQTSFQHTHLELIAKNCEFEHLKDGLIRDRIVCGTNSSRVKERLLREDGLTLDKAVGICRADEESRKQMKTLNKEEQAHALRMKATQRKVRADEIMRSESRIRVSVVESAEQLTREETVPHTKLSNVKLSKIYTSLTSYSGDKLKVVGKCSLHLKDKNCEFFVTDTNQSPLLGFKASHELGLIHVIMTVQTDVDDPAKSFPKVFTGLGCLEKPYHIKIDSSVNPVINPPRKIPAALREKLKGTLKEMEDKEVIRKVDEPTDWVNSLVVVEKPKTGKLRICLDTRNLNKAIKREHFALPTIEDITTRLTGAKYLSKLDYNNGYWQLRMDKESQLLTTFNSPFGRYCFLRMPFGIKSAQEVFQKRVSQLFENLKGVETDIDDILVWGTTRKEHDDRLRSVLNRCQEVGLTLNAEKCKFRVKEVTYIGHTLSADGVRPDQEKIRAIKEMPAPTDKKGVQRLLGTINYLAKFVPNMSAVTEPIRKLLKEEHEFIWTHEQQQAFEKLKDIITKNPVLSFCDVSKPVTVSCDASQCGLGAMLIQDNKPVAYASRSLTDAESRYGNIERELLGVLFGLERFNDYTYGKHINVESDHKPLEMIVRKSLGCAPPRLQRMLLRLQKFSLKYIPGKDLIVPDMLSRAPIKIYTNNEVENDIECFVNMVIRYTSMSDRNLEQITEETSNDDTLQILTRLIIDGWPDEKNEVPKEVFEYWNFRDELSNVNGIILKGEKIIIPTSMRKNMLNKLHEGHLGIEKTRKLARDSIFWQGINAQITDFISKCSVCLESRRSNTKEPMAESETPELPWMTVGTDIFYWNNNNYLIIVDYYSSYFEIAKLENIRASCVITHMKSVFARHGIPSKVRSDSGSQYVSDEFRQFAESWGFTHTVSSPHYQQSNGLAERFVQSVKKMLSKSKQDGKDPFIAMLKYRNTPLENLDSPAQLLMNRRLRTTIPTIKNRLKPKCGNLKNTQRKMKQQKMNQKQYYDKSSKPLPELQLNDTIRFQHNPKGKWDQGTVVRNNNTPNSYVIETPEGQIFKRNRKHLLRTKEDKIEQTSLEEAIENNHNDFDNITDEQSLEPSVRRSERSVKKPTRLIEEC